MVEYWGMVSNYMKIIMNGKIPTEEEELVCLFFCQKQKKEELVLRSKQRAIGKSLCKIVVEGNSIIPGLRSQLVGSVLDYPEK